MQEMLKRTGYLQSQKCLLSNYYKRKNNNHAVKTTKLYQPTDQNYFHLIGTNGYHVPLDTILWRIHLKILCSLKRISLIYLQGNASKNIKLKDIVWKCPVFFKNVKVTKRKAEGRFQIQTKKDTQLNPLWSQPRSQSRKSIKYRYNWDDWQN